MTVLNRSWKNGLRMWKWVSENLPDGFSEASGDMKQFVIEALKREWLRKNHFTKSLLSDCFFCAYDRKHGNECDSCPAGLVKAGFHCLDWGYSYVNNPINFYERLVKLNKIRLGAE